HRDVVGELDQRLAAYAFAVEQHYDLFDILADRQVYLGVRHPHRNDRGIVQTLAAGDRHTVAGLVGGGGPDANRSVLCKQGPPFGQGQRGEQVTLLARHRIYQRLAVVDEGDDEIGCAAGVVGQRHLEPLGVPADAIDHQLRARSPQPDDPRAQPILDTRQRLTPKTAGDRRDVARLAVDLSTSRTLAVAGDDDAVFVGLRRLRVGGRRGFLRIGRERQGERAEGGSTKNCAKAVHTSTG